MSDEFPIVILDADGVVDRVSSVEEAEEYLASMPAENLRWEFEEGGHDDPRPDPLTHPEYWTE